MSALSYNKDYALNAICPYFTMFPLEYPLKHLNRYKSEISSVIDPFCGRGTTLYAARKLGIPAWGIDSSPVAVAIAKAKLASCSIEDVLELAKLLISKNPICIPNSEFFSLLYSENTLRTICSLREGLLALPSDSDASVILRALCLGALHGPLNKSADSAAYFSNQMPRTFSSKPAYSIKYWKDRGMKAPEVDVLKCLTRKIQRINDLQTFQSGLFNQVIQGDSQDNDTFINVDQNFSTVITSPPYYGMNTYVQDQWLRNWFLGGTEEVDYSKGVQLIHSSAHSFVESLAKVWNNMASTKSDTLRMFVRFGAIPSTNVDSCELMKISLEESNAQWKIISIRNADTAHSGKRQATQMRSQSKALVEYDFHVVRI